MDESLWSSDSRDSLSGLALHFFIFILHEICNTSNTWSAASSLEVMLQWSHFSQRGQRSPLSPLVSCGKARGWGRGKNEWLKARSDEKRGCQSIVARLAHPLMELYWGRAPRGSTPASGHVRAQDKLLQGAWHCPKALRCPLSTKPLLHTGRSQQRPHRYS